MHICSFRWEVTLERGPDQVVHPGLLVRFVWRIGYSQLDSKELMVIDAKSVRIDHFIPMEFLRSAVCINLQEYESLQALEEVHSSSRARAAFCLSL